MIKAVLFDMGGTIVEAMDPPTAFKIHQKILRAHGVRRTLAQIADAHTEAEKTLDLRGQANLGKSFWIQFNSLLLKQLGANENPSELAKAINDEWWNYVDLTPFPDVLPVLHVLRDRELRLGIVSNWLESELQFVLNKIGLKGFFDAEVGVDTFKSAKPDRHIFLGALNKLEVSSDEALFVGDCPERDYGGASNAGIRVLLINRGNKPHCCEVASIRSFNDLLQYL